jgi:hypothetical protein
MLTFLRITGMINNNEEGWTWVHLTLCIHTRFPIHTLCIHTLYMCNVYHTQGCDNLIGGETRNNDKHVVRFAVYDLSRKQTVQLTPRHEKTLAELALNLNAIEKEYEKIVGRPIWGEEAFRNEHKGVFYLGQNKGDDPESEIID